MTKSQITNTNCQPEFFFITFFKREEDSVSSSLFDLKQQKINYGGLMKSLRMIINP